MSEYEKDRNGGSQAEAALVLLLLFSIIVGFLFICLLNSYSQQAHRNNGYHGGESAKNDNQDVEDLIAGYLFFGDGSGRRK